MIGKHKQISLQMFCDTKSLQHKSNLGILLKPTVGYWRYKMLILPFSVFLNKILSKPLIYSTALNYDCCCCCCYCWWWWWWWWWWCVCVCVCVCVFTTYFILINPPVSYNFKNLLSGYRAQLLFYDMTENSLRLYSSDIFSKLTQETLF